MSKLGKMIGSFGPFCIFKRSGGLFVTLETLSASRRFGGNPRRSYAPVNRVAVATRAEADEIIAACLTVEGGMQ